MPTGQHPWLVVGADGAIGGELLRRLSAAGRPALGTTRRADRAGLFLDLAGEPSSWQLPDSVAVAFLCAAVTSVERCQQFPADTRVVNVERTLRLARRLRERGAHVVFLSTNQVFDGAKPHRKPDDRPRPQTEYGRQKAEVEGALLSAGAATVVRFTKVVAPGMKLLRSWLDAFLAGVAVEPFGDMVISPVPLAFAAEVLARVGEQTPGGIIQLSGEADVTYAELARRLADRCEVSRELVRPVSFASKGLPPEMAPEHTTLDIARLTSELGLTPPPVWETLAALFEGLFHE
ncbi:MAG TPA: sugar nucleotide-binding protein [Gemmataceae bacterium]|nr:sugar nucleotide-binding protein [Gemmataceae bacterium]